LKKKLFAIYLVTLDLEYIFGINDVRISPLIGVF